MQVREALPGDFDAITRLYQQLNPDDPVLEGEPARALYESICANPLLTLLVGEQDNTVIATCYTNLIPNLSRGMAPYLVVENVVVEKRLRNSGLGQQLLKTALALAWQQGCYKVMLQTGSRREATHQFYRSTGFRDDDKFAFVARPPGA